MTILTLNYDNFNTIMTILTLNHDNLTHHHDTTTQIYSV